MRWPVPMIGRRSPAALTLLLLTVAAVEAKPDFSQSTVTSDPTSVQEGDLVTFSVLVVNSGDQGAPHTEIDLEFPLEAMFVGLTGFDAATVDVAQKTLHGAVDLAAGGRHRFQFRVIVPRDAGGRILSPDLRVRNLFLGAEFYGGTEVVVGTKRRSDGVAVGPIRIAPAGLALLAILTLFPILYVFLRSRTGAGPIVALVIAIGFWTLFAAMAARDYRTLRDWHETSCMIRDSRLRPGSAAPAAPFVSGRTRRETATYAPLLALEYTADGRQMVSTGFDTGSRVSIGGIGGALTEFARWPPGSTVPCWFDPGRPEDVVVIRGFGGAYLFALFPLPLFLFGAWSVAKGRRRRAR